MVPLNFVLEANNLGLMIDLFLALLLVTLGLVLIIGVESKSTLVIGGLFHTQHVVKCTLPIMKLFQTFLHRSGLGLELSSFLYMVPGSVALKFLFLFALDFYFQFCIYSSLLSVLHLV